MGSDSAVGTEPVQSAGNRHSEGGRELDCCEDPESELDSMLELLAGCWIVDMNFNYDRVAAFYALYALNLPYIKFSRSVLSQDLGEAIAIRMNGMFLC